MEGPAKQAVVRVEKPTIGAENMMAAGTTAHQGAETEKGSQYKGCTVAACKMFLEAFVKTNSVQQSLI